MYRSILLLYFILPFYGIAQIKMHSHNDYLQPIPFKTAFERHFDSIEADLILKNDTLFVSHEYKSIQAQNTFIQGYLEPLKQQTFSKELQLLIDLKTDYVSTLPALIASLNSYKDYLFPKGKVKIVISGNMPPPEEFRRYPKYIFFDGRPDTIYSKQQLKRIALISQSFRKYSWWNGLGEISQTDEEKIRNVITSAHKLNKPIRFWATPDHENAWKTFIDLGVDYINTDKVNALADFMSRQYTLP